MAVETCIIHIWPGTISKTLNICPLTHVSRSANPPDVFNYYWSLHVWVHMKLPDNSMTSIKQYLSSSNFSLILTLMIVAPHIHMFDWKIIVINQIFISQIFHSYCTLNFGLLYTCLYLMCEFCNHWTWEHEYHVGWHDEKHGLQPCLKTW